MQIGEKLKNRLFEPASHKIAIHMSPSGFDPYGKYEPEKESEYEIAAKKIEDALEFMGIEIPGDQGMLWHQTSAYMTIEQTKQFIEKYNYLIEKIDTYP